MATTTKVTLTEEQRQQIAKDLRISYEEIPNEIAILAVSSEAGENLGIPKDLMGRFAPALIVT